MVEGLVAFAGGDLSLPSPCSALLLPAFFAYAFGSPGQGPLLGGLLTIAATSGGALPGAVRLAIFAARMAVPLFLLALLWERIGATGRIRLRGGEVTIGPLRRHLTTVISNLMFIGLGTEFIVFEGSNAWAACMPRSEPWTCRSISNASSGDSPIRRRRSWRSSCWRPLSSSQPAGGGVARCGHRRPD